MKKMALLLAALLLLSSLAGCGKSSKGEASVESVRPERCGTGGSLRWSRQRSGRDKDRKGREPAGGLRGREGRG